MREKVSRCPGKEENDVSMNIGFLYILKCNDGSFYTGSTNNLERRLEEHQQGIGANYTSKRLPLELVYYEIYDKVEHAFYREKQIQRWTHKKKEALVKGEFNKLPILAKKVFCGKNPVASIHSGCERL